MKRMPARPDLGHLKKQAKQLLADYRAGNAGALDRFRTALPLAAGRDDAAIAGLGLRLHDAQSCVAREYGFVSWLELSRFVAARQAQDVGPEAARLHWLHLVYAGDIAGSTNAARPSVAARLLEAEPGLLGDDASLACAVGDLDSLRQAIARDPGWVHQASGPLQLPPLIAVTHSSLLRLPAFAPRLRACVALLLAAGADANQRVGNRWPPDSLATPSATSHLSALYGAAGQNHDLDATRLLLDAGADPNDGESLYHALESPTCTALLLQAGARVAGSNAMYRALDLDDPTALQLLLAHGGNANEPALGPATAAWPSPLLWAIRRRRSPAHIQALLQAGADTAVTTADGVGPWLLALRFGLTDVAHLLRPADGTAELAPEEAFIAACARADAPAARALHAAHPGIVLRLTPAQHRLLPELAAQGCAEAVRLMVELGWPIAVPGGDLEGSALNQAVFRGDAAMARFLLAHGASWTERHAYDDDVTGSLSWASRNEPIEGGDWPGCAAALVEHGLPAVQADPLGDKAVFIGARRMEFSEAVVESLLAAQHARDCA